MQGVFLYVVLYHIYNSHNRELHRVYLVRLGKLFGTPQSIEIAGYGHIATSAFSLASPRVLSGLSMGFWTGTLLGL